MVGEDMAHALARAFAPERDDDALAGSLQRVNMARHSFEYIAARLGALGSKAVALPDVDIDDGAPLLGDREWCQACQCGSIEPGSQLTFVQVEPIGTQRLVRRAGAALREHLLACLVIVSDLAQTLARGILRQRLQNYRRANHVIEKRGEPVMEQGQPVL